MDPAVSLIPADDWLTLTELAGLLGVGLSTASRYFKNGELSHLEHGFRPCGHRRFSRSLIDAELRRASGSTHSHPAPKRTSRRVSVAAPSPQRQTSSAVSETGELGRACRGDEG